MPEFASPWAFLVPCVAAMALALVPARGGGVPLPGHGDPAAPAGPAGTIGARVLARLPGSLHGAALAALALAAAAPYTVSSAAATTSGVAIMLAVDVSPSMGEPWSGGASRLDAVRGEVARFLQGRDGDAVGLVLFGGEALVRVPPLQDRRALEAALAAATVGELGEGTALGTAVGLAADRLRGVESPSRVIVVFTDGEDNAGALDPLTAAAAAAALGQRVHVVDASAGGDPRLLLSGLARRGGGGHHVAGDAAGMARALAALDAMEAGPLPSAPRGDRTPAWNGLLLVALSLVLAERALRAGRWGVIP